MKLDLLRFAEQPPPNFGIPNKIGLDARNLMGLFSSIQTNAG